MNPFISVFHKITRQTATCEPTSCLSSVVAECTGIIVARSENKNHGRLERNKGREGLGSLCVCLCVLHCVKGQAPNLGLDVFVLLTVACMHNLTFSLPTPQGWIKRECTGLQFYKV